MCSASIGCLTCAAGTQGTARVATGFNALAETSSINRETSFRGVLFGAQTWVQTIPVTAGAHTIHCLIRDSTGAPVIQYFDPTISVIFVDLSSTGVSAPQVGAGGPTGTEGR